MGFLKNLTKKGLIGPSEAALVLKVQHSPNAQLKSFIYRSVACTSVFFDHFYNDESFLRNYKKYLNSDSVREVFKLLAMYDLSVLLSGSMVSDKDKGEFKKNTLFLLDCTDEESQFYQEFFERRLKLPMADNAKEFYRFLFSRVFKIPIPNKNEEELMLRIFIERVGIMNNLENH
jgi:hypothetical protein